MENPSKEELEEIIERIFGIIEEVFINSRRLTLETEKITNVFSFSKGMIPVDELKALETLVEASSLLRITNMLKESLRKLIKEKLPEQYGAACLIFGEDSNS